MIEGDGSALLTADEKNAQRIDRLMILNLDEDSLVCPNCGCYIVDPKTRAGRKFGVCDVCYKRAMKESRIQAMYEVLAQKELKAAQKNLERERKREHIPPGSNRNGSTAWLK